MAQPVAGSSPASFANISVAQLVEQRTPNPQVVGSIPARYAREVIMSNINTYYNKHFPMAQGVGRAVALDRFVAMLNPANRGANFKWENYPEWCGSSAGISCFMGFAPSVWKRYGKELRKVAEESAVRCANECLKDSAILAWWPNVCPPKIDTDIP